jgi:hypothetical protein
MSNLPFSWNEVMAEVDKYQRPVRGTIQLTPHQVEFLKKCIAKKVCYPDIKKYWKKLGWGDISISSAKRRVDLVKELCSR